MDYRSIGGYYFADINVSTGLLTEKKPAGKCKGVIMVFSTGRTSIDPHFLSFKQYNGAIDAARHVFKAEGIPGFYRGMWPNLSESGFSCSCKYPVYLSHTVKAMPATAAQFWVYELVKEYLMVEWKPHLD
jgi:hypothetical protein